jgi:hypothetical protein
MEYLQLNSGESADAAWIRMRSKLGTGRHLDETHILLPQNVPAVGGYTPSVGDDQPTTIANGGETSPTADTTQIPNAGGADTPKPGSVFGTSGEYTPLSIPATSALNLLGRIESQGITPGSQLRAMNLQVDKLTGAQLLDIIKKLPDGITYELGVEKEQES